LDVAPSTLERVYDLLAEKQLEIPDALDKRRGLLRKPGPHPSHYDSAVASAAASVDGDMKQLLSPGEYEQVSLLTDSARFLVAEISRLYDPVLSRNGMPLATRS
jgi:hypothetical protein